jgi:hypothetical protein
MALMVRFKFCEISLLGWHERSVRSWAHSIAGLCTRAPRRTFGVPPNPSELQRFRLVTAQRNSTT